MTEQFLSTYIRTTDAPSPIRLHSLGPGSAGPSWSWAAAAGRHLPANDTINESLHSAAAGAEHDASSTQTTTTTLPLSPRHRDVTAAGAQQIIESLARYLYLCSISISTLLSYRIKEALVNTYSRMW